MLTKNSSRRKFIKSLLASGTSFCFLGCPNFIKAQTNEQHKFEIDSKMSFQKVFGFAYQRGFIPLMKIMGQEIGKEKFIDLLKKASNKMANESTKKWAKSLENNDFASFTEPMRNPDHFWKNVLSFEIIEDSETVLEVKIHECLWAKTFKESNAEDIGYSCICYPDFVAAQAFNPKMKLERTKTLMQGNDCCNHRWILEA
jgi:hypothetical protein